MRIAIVSLLWLVVCTTTATAGDWWETIEVKGDLRYRHEMIDTDDAVARHRQRIRARLAVQGQVAEHTRATVQLATGSTDPVSTNQSLDGAFSSKRVVLDQAYFDFTPLTAPGLSIMAGKFGNPFFKPGRSELLWDSDLTPEGVVASLNRQAATVDWTGIVAGLWIEERSTDADSWLGAAQGVARLWLGERQSSVAIGAGYFGYSNTAGQAAFFDGLAKGNTLDAGGAYVNDYKLIELFGEATHRLGETPVTIFADLVRNTEADSLETGWKFGVRLGRAKQPGSWECRYSYRELEQDAVIGTFSDSDFRGGGTDARGHELGGAYQLATNMAFKISYFINQLGLDQEESDFRRLQIDLQLKF